MRCLLPLLLAVALSLVACDDSAPDAAPISFTDGVAAGDVRATSAELWARASRGGTVVAEVSTDVSFRNDVLTFETEISIEHDFTVQEAATALTPETRYYYRFRAGDSASDTGTFVTPPDDASANPVRFVFAGDSDGTRDASGMPAHGEFEALRAATDENPAFFLYLGDTIYADRGEPATTLEAYRAKYAANRTYAALSGLLQETSVVAMWDDHEVVNDFSGRTADPAMLAAARQAFREWFPMTDSDDDATLHRSLRWGKDVELIVLDTRGFRDLAATDACDDDPLPAGALPGAPDSLQGVRTLAQLPATLPQSCIDLLQTPDRSMLGADQKQFLFDRLRTSDATWKIVATSVPIQALLFAPYDRWEGYPAERREVLEFIRDNEIKNVVFLSTDLHANIFGPVRIDPFGDSPPVAYEAIVGPIAAETLEQDIVDVLGQGGAGLLTPFLTGIVGVDCAELDAFAFGLVEADGSALTITAKDADGRELCAKTLEA